jgi:hypothetical protein
METTQNVGGRDRLVRALLAALLSILALRWLRGGKTGRGLLAGVGALGFGFNATTGYCGANDALGVDTTAGDTPGTEIEFDSNDSNSGTDTDQPAKARLMCAACGDPIVPGQLRGPNEQDRIVHDSCA